MSEQPADDVGSLAEEAGRFFDALGEWSASMASQRTSAATDLGASLGAQVSALWHEVDGHLATGDAECRYCPLCRSVHAVRSLTPEVKAHLASAASSLLQAAAGVLATAQPGEAATTHDSASTTIPVDDEAWPDDDHDDRQDGQDDGEHGSQSPGA